MSTTGVIIGVLLQVAIGWQELPSPELATTEVRAVEVMSDGSVWFALRDRSVARLRGDEMDWITAEVGILNRGVADLFQDDEGWVWAAGVGGFAVFDGEQWSEGVVVAGGSPRVVFDVSQEEGGTIWLSTSRGAARQTSSGWELISDADGLPHQVVHATLADGERTWLACRRGLAFLTESGITIVFPEINFRSALRDDATGELWFGTSDGVFRWDGEVWARFRRGEAIFPKVVGRNGNVWAASASSGLLRFDGDSWIPVPLPPHLEGAEVFDVAEGEDGSCAFSKL